MLFALMLICKLISLPSGFGNLGISFTYLFFAIISMIYGPIYGAVVGIFSDIIGFFIDSNGGMFNLGYTLQASLTGFIYGLCLFKRKFPFKNALVSRVFVNMLINTIMGSFLFIFVMYFDPSMTGKEYMSLVKSYMTLLVLPKNVGIPMFTIIWSITILGIVLNAIDLKKYKVISFISYLILGWLVIFAFKPLMDNLATGGFILLLAGGISYTLGAIFYGFGRKVKYMHSIFHLFVLAGSILQFFSILLYVI